MRVPAGQRPTRATIRGMLETRPRRASGGANRRGPARKREPGPGTGTAGECGQRRRGGDKQTGRGAPDGTDISRRGTAAVGVSLPWRSSRRLGACHVLGSSKEGEAHGVSHALRKVSKEAARRAHTGVSGPACAHGCVRIGPEAYLDLPIQACPPSHQHLHLRMTLLTIAGADLPQLGGQLKGVLTQPQTAQSVRDTYMVRRAGNRAIRPYGRGSTGQKSRKKRERMPGGKEARGHGCEAGGWAQEDPGRQGGTGWQRMRRVPAGCRRRGRESAASTRTAGRRVSPARVAYGKPRPGTKRAQATRNEGARYTTHMGGL